MALRADAKSFGKIADELNRAEIPTKKGCAWRAMQVQCIVNRNTVQWALIEMWSA
jgi:hypothetical protein